MATHQSVRESQLAGLLRMLRLPGHWDQYGPDGKKQAKSSWGPGAQTWKVLVYDKFCQEAIGPLLKVGSLRNQGVTLNVSISNERLPVADVPAVYFVEPTEENVQKICGDLNKGLYESCYVNFASAAPRHLLEELARGATRADAAAKVLGVFDRYSSFVSLSPTLFSLNLPCVYQTLHSPSIEDHTILRYVERIVDGLISVLVTMRAVPVIRCPPGELAEAVARSLEKRLRELLGKGGTIVSELFSSSAVGRPDAGGATAPRPLLCVLDREVDLVTMLHHSWTYSSLAHDVLGMRLNKLTVPIEESANPAAPPKTKVYDIDEGDSFWTAHWGEPFPTVAEAVQEALEDFHKKREEMHMSGDGGGGVLSGSGLGDVAAAINALPEMTEKKRSIDMHTNVATALLHEIKERELDRYYEIEDQFASQSVGTSVSQLEQLMKGQKGTALDKTRALMVLCLSKPSITPAQLQGLIETLTACGGDPSGVDYLQHLAKMRILAMPSVAVKRSDAPDEGLLSGAAAMLRCGISAADAMRAKGEGLLSAGLKNIRAVVASDKPSPACEVLESLMEQRSDGPTDSCYLYLDPSAPPGAEARMSAPFRTAVVFVVGGGNYAEMQALSEWALKKGRQVTYGSTDIVSPAQFVDELCHLGRAQGGDMR